MSLALQLHSGVSLLPALANILAAMQGAGSSPSDSISRVTDFITQLLTDQPGIRKEQKRKEDEEFELAMQHPLFQQYLAGHRGN